MRVTEQMVIERYSHVMHIVSNVEGRLKPGLDALAVLRATFPAGTVTGAPKVRAMEIIDELEPVKRGIYAGAVGYIGYHGDMDLAIAIRTAVLKGGMLHVQAAAGIVADSVPRERVERDQHQGAGAAAGGRDGDRWARHEGGMRAGAKGGAGRGVRATRDRASVLVDAQRPFPAAAERRASKPLPRGEQAHQPVESPTPDAHHAAAAARAAKTAFGFATARGRLIGRSGSGHAGRLSVRLVLRPRHPEKVVRLRDRVAAVTGCPDRDGRTGGPSPAQRDRACC